MAITENDKKLALQSLQDVYIRIEVLNAYLTPLGNSTGYITSGNINIDGNNDLRRSLSIDFVLLDGGGQDNITETYWLDKYIRVYLGVNDISSGTIEWYNYGIFIIEDSSLTIDMNNGTISLTASDYIMVLNGSKYGVLPGANLVFPQGKPIGELVKEVLLLSDKVQRHKIDVDATLVLPYELKIDSASSIFDILSTIVSIYPSYEMFFDVDGAFVYRPIPSEGNEGAPVFDNIFMKKVVVSENKTINYTDIKNDIVVMGAVLESEYETAELPVIENNILKLTYEQNFSSLTDHAMFGFAIDGLPPVSSKQFIAIQINGLAAGNLVDSKGDRVIPKLQDELVDEGLTGYLADDYIYVKYQEATRDFLYLGHKQIRGTAQETNPSSPFYIGKDVGLLTEVLSGGEFDNIYSEESANDRASYELYLRSRISDAISLQTTPLLCMTDVGEILSYVPTSTRENREYVVNSISINFDNSSISYSLTAHRRYKAFSWL